MKSINKKEDASRKLGGHEIENSCGSSDKITHIFAKFFIDLIISYYLAGKFVSFSIVEHYMHYSQAKTFVVIISLLLFINWCILTGKKEKGFKISILLISIFIGTYLSFWVKNALERVPTPVGDFFIYFINYLFIFFVLALILNYVISAVSDLLRKG